MLFDGDQIGFLALADFVHFNNKRPMDRDRDRSWSWDSQLGPGLCVMMLKPQRPPQMRGERGIIKARYGSTSPWQLDSHAAVVPGAHSTHTVTESSRQQRVKPEPLRSWMLECCECVPPRKNLPAREKVENIKSER